LLGAIAGFLSAYATEKPGAAGDIARAIGDVALTTRDKACEIDQKHHIVDKSKTAAANAWEHAKELDRQHRILDRFKDFVLFSWRETVEFIRRHMLLERGEETVGRGFEWLIKKMSGSRNEIEDAYDASLRTTARPYWR
jgi:hypothetical protein